MRDLVLRDEKLDILPCLRDNVSNEDGWIHSVAVVGSQVALWSDSHGLLSETSTTMAKSFSNLDPEQPSSLRLRPRKHPVYWFDDGSLILHVQDDLYRVHDTLLARKSGKVSSMIETAISIDKMNALAADALVGMGPDLVGCKYVVLDHDQGVLSEDVSELLEHLYQDKWASGIVNPTVLLFFSLTLNLPAQVSVIRHRICSHCSSHTSYQPRTT